MAESPSADSAGFSVPAYLQTLRPASSSSNRIDEGYSEAPNPSGGDTVMRMDTRLGETALVEQDLQCALPDWILNMSEEERSGQLA